MATLSIAYSSALRTLTLPSAPELFGLRTLKTRYGFVVPGAGKTPSCGFQLGDSRPWIAAGGTMVFHSRSAVPAARSCCTSVAAADPARSSLTSISFTYWCRIGSEACVHAASRVRTISCPTLYVVIAYGPSEYRTLPGVNGVSFRYSAGAADANGSAMMLSKSVAGCVSVKTMVELSGVLMPDTLVMPALIVAARAAGLSDGLALSNAVQNALKPAIVEM